MGGSTEHVEHAHHSRAHAAWAHAGVSRGPSPQRWPMIVVRRVKPLRSKCDRAGDCPASACDPCPDTRVPYPGYRRAHRLPHFLIAPRAAKLPFRVQLPWSSLTSRGLTPTSCLTHPASSLHPPRPMLPTHHPPTRVVRARATSRFIAHFM